KRRKRLRGARAGRRGGGDRRLPHSRRRRRWVRRPHAAARAPPAARDGARAVVCDGGCAPRGCDARRLRNVSLVPSRWGEAAVGRHDLVVCAHVAPLVGAGSPCPRDVGEIAARAGVLVHDAGGGDDKFFFGELYPVLLGRPYEHERDPDATLRALGELGVVPRVSLVEYRSDQPFTSLEEACDFWMAYMPLD